MLIYEAWSNLRAKIIIYTGKHHWKMTAYSHEKKGQINKRHHNVCASYVSLCVCVSACVIGCYGSQAFKGNFWMLILSKARAGLNFGRLPQRGCWLKANYTLQIGPRVHTGSANLTHSPGLWTGRAAAGRRACPPSALPNRQRGTTCQLRWTLRGLYQSYHACILGHNIV